MTTPESNSNPAASNSVSSSAASTEPTESTSTDSAEAATTPASGIKSRMSDAQRAMLASKSRGGGGHVQSVGKSHQPTQASGKKGPVEKKTRW